MTKVNLTLILIYNILHFSKCRFLWLLFKLRPALVNTGLSTSQNTTKYNCLQILRSCTLQVLYKVGLL